MNRDLGPVIGLIRLAMVASALMLVGKAIPDALSNDAGASKGRLLAKKERCVVEMMEYYERGIECKRKELPKAELYDPKRFVEVYGKRKM
jgi:hypothetical protein